MAVLYRLIPVLEHPALDDSHTSVRLDDEGLMDRMDKSLFRAGIGVALAITLHNFPEGMATFFLTLADPHVGLAVGVAIAIHNIPEGIAVAIPLYYATKSRAKAFGFGALSGLAEPLGAVLGYLVLRPFMSDSVLGITFAVVAGIMVYSSLDGLLPAVWQWPTRDLRADCWDGCDGGISGVISDLSVVAARGPLREASASQPFMNQNVLRH